LVLLPSLVGVCSCCEMRAVSWGFNAQLEARPPAAGWYSTADMLSRLALATALFCYCLATQPLRLARFALQYNRLWYGGFTGTAMTLLLPVTPAVLAAIAWGERLKQFVMREDGWDPRFGEEPCIWYQPPPSKAAAIIYDAFRPLADWVAAFVLFGDNRVAIDHTIRDTICTKEYWYGLLDSVGARRPLQLGSWDGAALRDVGRGVESGGCDLVCKISDSYLGIGDIVFKRGVDFATHGDIEAALRADARYAGRPAVLCEMVQPCAGLEASVSSDGFSAVHSFDIVTLRSPHISPCLPIGFSAVHSLDIVTLRTREGAKVLSLVLWTDTPETLPRHFRDTPETLPRRSLHTSQKGGGGACVWASALDSDPARTRALPEPNLLGTFPQTSPSSSSPDLASQADHQV